MAYIDVTSTKSEDMNYDDAYRWFLGESPYNGAYDQHVFSFTMICEYLQLDPKRLREQIRTKHAHRSKHLRGR
jgi:hypothetical protein